MLGSAHSVDLGGFYSCTAGNPLAIPMQNMTTFPEISGPAIVHLVTLLTLLLLRTVVK